MEIKTTLVQTKGKWYVCATIPNELRAQFNGQKQLKISTGTSDKSVAEKRRFSKSQIILDRIHRASLAEHPIIKATEQIFSLTHEIEKRYEAADILDPSRQISVISDVNHRNSYIENIDWMGTGDPETGMWIAQAQRQMEIAKSEFDQHLDSLRLETPEIPASHVNEFTLTNLLRRWVDIVKFKREKTKSSYEAHIRRLIKHVGDLPVRDLSKVHANRFVRELEENGLSHSTIETAVAASRKLLDYAEEIGEVETNVFRGLRLRGKGVSPRRRSTFSISQLEKLFKLAMNPRDRRCLQILASTGMRLDEVALLRFEDIKVDESSGIRYFDLTADEKLLKNEQASRRQVPVPDAIKFQKESGRIFNYRVDQDGKAENAASKALMRHIRKVRNFEDENLVVHSLRHTYKDWLRDAGIPKDLQDFLMGHAASSVGESYGQGYSMKVKKSAIDKLDLSFIFS